MPQILVVDDDECLRLSLCELLNNSGYTTCDAPNGELAIQILQKNRFDLVLLDMIMPEKDGYETIFHLRKNFPDVKIIVMSGGGKIEADFYLASVKVFGVCRTLKKPFKSKEMLSVVNEILAPCIEQKAMTS